MTSITAITSRNSALNPIWSPRLARAIECVQRIINQINLSQITGQFQAITFFHPAITNCGHIVEFMQADSVTCPVQGCGQLITNFQVLPEDLQTLLPATHRLVTLSYFEGEVPHLAQFHLNQARVHYLTLNYLASLDSNQNAFRYTKSSDAYSFIPRLYEKLGDPARAALSSLYLTLYRLNEGRFDEAGEGLQRLNYRSDELAELRVILRPNIDNYRSLISIENIEVKVPYLIAAIKTALNSSNEAEEEFFRNAVSPLVYCNPGYRVYLPPFTRELSAFLESPCPFTPGTVCGETHAVIPFIPLIKRGETFSPLSIASFKWESTLKDVIRNKRTIEPHFRWAVVPKKEIPGLQLNQLPPNYQLPSFFDMVRVHICSREFRAIQVALLCKHSDFGPNFVVFYKDGHLNLEPSDSINPDRIGILPIRYF